MYIGNLIENQGTIQSQLDKCWLQYASKIAVCDENERLSYTELQETVMKMANILQQHGVKNGDNVVLQVPNSIFFVKCFLAIVWLGAVPIPVIPLYKETELESIINQSQASVYVGDENNLELNFKSFHELAKSKELTIQTIISKQQCEIEMERTQLISQPYKSDSTDTIVMLLSGGTTDVPKLVPYTHKTYIDHTVTLVLHSGITEESVYLAALPVAHKFSHFSPGIIGTLFSGGKVVFSKTNSYEDVFPVIERERVTTIALVPSLVKIWLDILEWEKSFDISSLEVIQVGAALLDSETAKKIKLFFNCKLQHLYGMTEGIVTGTSLNDPDDIIFSCQGKLFGKNAEMKIVNDYDEEVTNGDVGELLVRGGFLFSGYYKRIQDNHLFFTDDGFFRTGDLVKLTKEKNVQVIGRKKELINRAGEKIIPSEIENYIRKYPRVKDVALIPVEDDGLGERSVAFIMTEQSILRNDIQDYFNECKIANYKVPDQVICLTQFPLTKVGKIDKKQLQEKASNSGV